MAIRRKLNRGVICTRSPRNMASRPNLISRMKASSKRAHKSANKCLGGILDGHTLYLSTAGTMPFSIGGIKGYYNNEMKWCEL